MIALVVVRARRRRVEWRNQPGLSVVSPYDPEFIGPAVGSADIAKSAPTKDESHTNSDTGSADQHNLTPIVHEIPPDVVEFLIPEFRPNLDICQVDLCYPDVDFAHWRSSGMAAMRFMDGEEALTVYFQGLDVVPFDGVFVRFDHPRSGQQSYLLSELLDVRESEITEDEAALRLSADCDAPMRETQGKGGPTKFHDFDTSKECIEVFVPEARLPTTAVSISSTSDGADALVLVDGQVVAILIGAIDAGPHNVKLVAVDQTAAA